MFAGFSVLTTFSIQISAVMISSAQFRNEMMGDGFFGATAGCFEQ